jgi:hypothetical protein
MGMKLSNLAGQSFTFTKKNGELSLQSNMPSKQQFIVINDEVYERRRVHQFKISDVDDPELYAAHPIWEWQQTEHGKWVMAHTHEPTFHILADPISYGYQISITAHITPKRWTEYVLRGWYTG